eukprot:4566359-Heterocapsa_arctica.AAC.1
MSPGDFQIPTQVARKKRIPIVKKSDQRFNVNSLDDNDQQDVLVVGPSTPGLQVKKVFIKVEGAMDSGASASVAPLEAALGVK